MKGMRGGNTSGNKIVFNDVAHQLRIVFQFHFLQESGTISTDRFYADEQVMSDLGWSLSLSDHTEDLKFTVRKPFVG